MLRHFEIYIYSYMVCTEDKNCMVSDFKNSVSLVNNGKEFEDFIIYI